MLRQDYTGATKNNGSYMFDSPSFYHEEPPKETYIL